jgi:hypothetical protein
MRRETLASRQQSCTLDCYPAYGGAHHFRRRFRLGYLSGTARSISRDQGPAIFFERFYRADPSRSSEVRDSGLGLSICREIVLAHGGQIWLERPRPGWTAFVFTLPAAQDERDRAEAQKLAPGPKGDRSDGTLKQSASDTPPAWWPIHAYSEAASPDPVLLPTHP